MTVGDKVLSHLAAKNGYKVWELPESIAQSPSLVTVPISNNTTAFVNTADGSMYSLPNRSQIVAPNTMSNNNQQHIHHKNHHQPNNNNQSVMGPKESTICYPQLMEIESAWDAACKANGTYKPREILRADAFRTEISTYSKQGVREGCHVYTPRESKHLLLSPRTPTEFQCDERFNDGLYMSLQGDVNPVGSSNIDDYIRTYPDARTKIYMDAAIGNQGCCCEYDKTPLDRFLTKNKNVNSAIALRATLSEDCKKHVYEAPDTRQIKQFHETASSKFQELWKQLNYLMGQDTPKAKSPWDAMGGEDDDMCIT